MPAAISIQSGVLFCRLGFQFAVVWSQQFIQSFTGRIRCVHPTFLRFGARDHRHAIVITRVNSFGVVVTIVWHSIAWPSLPLNGCHNPAKSTSRSTGWMVSDRMAAPCCTEWLCGSCQRGAIVVEVAAGVRRIAVIANPISQIEVERLRTETAQRPGTIGAIADRIVVVSERACRTAATDRFARQQGFCLTLTFEKPAYQPIDDLGKISCRPDFAIAAYPGYLKPNDKDELARGLEVPTNAPPVFLVHGSDDIISPPEHSVVMYLARQKAGVLAELQLYVGTAHDFGSARVNVRTASGPTLARVGCGIRGS